MKLNLRNILLITALLMGLFVINSCDNDRDPVIARNYTAMIDSEDWTWDELDITLGNGVISVETKRNNGETLTFMLKEERTGMFYLDKDTKHWATYVFDQTYSTPPFTSFANNNASGWVNIVQIDYLHNKVRGTFEFDLVRPSDGALRLVTNGDFLLTFESE